MSSYYHVDVVVEGALEDEHDFKEWWQVEAYIDSVREEADCDGQLTEVFVIEHPHAISDEECSCSQYLQSHQPDYVWNSK